MKKQVLLVLLGCGLILAAFLAYRAWHTQQLQGPDAPLAQDIDTVLEETAEEVSEEEVSEVSEETPLIPETAVTLPSALNIDLPFYTQAPFSNWDYPWQEACEEASIALVANLYLEKNWTREEFNDELLRLVEWEMQNFGAYEHTTVEQTVQMIEENYGLQTLVHDNPTYEELQVILNRGHLIVAPFAGKLLNNPNFKNGGPNYHMLVIKGYDATQNQVVTHDVGTRNGADYVYSWEVISLALHDWNDNSIEQGTPRWIEVYP